MDAWNASASPCLEPGPFPEGIYCHMGRARESHGLAQITSRACQTCQGRSTAGAGPWRCAAGGEKKPQVLRPGVGKGGPSMKGRKSARGYSVQSGPMQDADVVRIQVETLCQENAQLAVGAGLGERLAQLHHTTPFVAAGASAARLAAAVGHEVRVVLGSHGARLVARGGCRP